MSVLPSTAVTVSALQTLRARLFALPDEHILPESDLTVGRPGMALWQILVCRLSIRLVVQRLAKCIRRIGVKENLDLRRDVI